MSELQYLEAIRNFYDEYYDHGKYKANCKKRLISLIRDDKFLTGLHDCTVRQLEDVEIGPFGIDKVTILFPVSRTTAKRICSVLTDHYKCVDNCKIKFVPCTKDDYFKNHLNLKWSNVDSSVSIFFEQRELIREHNLKVSFNYTKHRELTLELLCLIIENIPPSLVNKVLKNTRINEFEQYLDFKDIPVFLLLVGKTAITKNTHFFNDISHREFLETMYISKGLSREIKSYDKTKERETTGRDGGFYKKNGIVTRLEMSVHRNKLNKEDRDTKFRFAQWKSYTTFTHSLKIYSPLLLSKLNESQIDYILKYGFYTFYIENRFTAKIDFKNYILEYDMKSKRFINSWTSILMGQFIADLGKMVGIDIVKLGDEARSEEAERANRANRALNIQSSRG